jgi:ABC-type antimicrobial peptide transport system permease subunit
VALGVLGLLGAMLAVTGIFGMASYTVSKRLRELRIRMALGARRKQLLGAALGRAFLLLSVGSVAGLLLGILATKVLSYIVVPGVAKRSASVGRSGAHDARTGARGCLDSSAKGASRRSDDPAAGGVKEQGIRIWE